MKTKEVDLPSGLKAEIRRIGPVAQSKLAAMVPSLPPGLARFGIRNLDDLEKRSVKDLIAKGDADLLPEILEWHGKHEEAEAEARVARVCYCTVAILVPKGKGGARHDNITPENIDTLLDEPDFFALEEYVKQFAEEGAANVAPFSKTQTGS